jgi:hypothetical protein
MLDKATIDYILNYYSRFMTVQEAAAAKHHNTSIKFRESLSNDTDGEKAAFLKQKEWLSGNKDVLNLLENGYEQFRLNTAERILKENAGKIYFNRCPKCELLARTPQAKQCRYCGYNWHIYAVATFQITTVFNIAGRGLFIAGYILTGEVRTGMKADLTTLGLAVKPIISAIEFVRHNKNGIVWEDVALGFVEISDQDAVLLQSSGPFQTPVIIEDPKAG